MSTRRVSFEKSFDPRGLCKRDETLRFDLMTKLEYLKDFNPRQRGALNTVLKGCTFDNIFNVLLPRYQEGFLDLNGRPRERCFPFEILSNGNFRPPKVSRRSPNLQGLGRQRFIEYVESSLASNYHVEARRLLVQKYELCRKPLIGPDTSDFEFLQMMLLPIELERARLKYLLKKASRQGYVSRLTTLKFELRFNQKLEREDIQCLVAAVGEKVQLTHEDESEDLFVASTTSDGLILMYPINTEFTSTHNIGGVVGPEESSFLSRARMLPVDAKFYAAPLNYKLLVTGVIDAITACGPEWFGFREVHMVGLPMIPLERIEKVSNREGLFNPNISNQQLAFVVMALTNALERGILFCLGAAGTGKTHAMDEYVFQLTHHHQEDCPGSALIYLAQPTNDAVNRTVTRLKDKGFPLDKLLVVRGEHAFSNARRVPGVRYTKITRYDPDDNVQVIVGTVNVLARLKLHRDNTVGVMLKPPAAILLEEVCSYNAMVAMTLMVTSGQPGSTVCTGDPMQIEPKWLSKTAELSYGQTTLVDAAKRKPGTFEEDCTYPTPTPRNGVLLTEVHRTTSYLTELVAPFYSNAVTTSSSTSQNDADAVTLMESLRGVKYIEGVHTFLWLNVDSPCFRHEITESWYNRGEAAIVARVADAITNVTSDSKVLLVSGYAQQATVMKSYFGQEREDLIVGSVDECQGYESEIVIGSLVRSSLGDGKLKQTLGFMVSPRRINTLLTRGKKLVILVGSAKYFRQGGSRFWHYLLDRASIRDIID